MKQNTFSTYFSQTKSKTTGLHIFKIHLYNKEANVHTLFRYIYQQQRRKINYCKYWRRKKEVVSESLVVFPNEILIVRVQ